MNDKPGGDDRPGAAHSAGDGRDVSRVRIAAGLRRDNVVLPLRRPYVPTGNCKSQSVSPLSFLACKTTESVVFGKMLCEESHVKRLTQVHDRRRRRAEGAQGKTHPPDIADVLRLELRVEAWQIIGDSPTELDSVINKDTSIPQRVQNRHLVVHAEGRSRSSIHARGPATNSVSSTQPRPHGGIPPTVVTMQCEGADAAQTGNFNHPRP